MHEVKAVVRPEMLEHVLTQLRSIPELSGLAVSRIRAFGRRVLHSGAPGLESAEVEMARIELVATEQLLDRFLEAIALAARTGRHGDGKISVSPVTEMIRIRTGERGPDAL